ncbi:hypothetical protein ABBQ38_009584 [Trebouxia sp. C0009 RCD-2024]
MEVAEWVCSMGSLDGVTVWVCCRIVLQNCMPHAQQTLHRHIHLLVIVGRAFSAQFAWGPCVSFVLACALHGDTIEGAMLEPRHGVWLVQMGQYEKMSDMHQIGLMIDAVLVSRPEPLNTVVDLLTTKQLLASEALQHQWIEQGLDELC